MTMREAFKAMIETGEYKNILPVAGILTAIYFITYGLSALAQGGII